jgi:hypothetical protein
LLLWAALKSLDLAGHPSGITRNTENNPVRFNPVPSSPVPQSAANQIFAPHRTRAVKALNAGVQSI